MHSPYGLMQFVVFEKFTSAYLSQIAREKSFDYFLVICKKQFLSRFSTLRDKWSVKLLQLYWKKKIDMNLSKRKNLFTLSKSCMKTEQSLDSLCGRFSGRLLGYLFAFCFSLRTSDGIFWLGFCHAVLIGSGIFQFSQAQVYVFVLAAFV